MRRGVSLRLLVGGLAVACASVLGPSPAASEPTAAVVSRVTAREFAFALSRRSVPAGTTVRFVVRNRGKVSHRFRVGAKRTRLLRPGTSQTITVEFAEAGRVSFLCTVGRHAKKGMRGSIRVTEPPVPTPTVEPVPPPDVAGSSTLTDIGTFERPILVTAPPGDPRQFVVEQTGAVWMIRSGETLEMPFLDLRGRVTALGESGLLSIAFAPDYALSGLVYAFYNARSGPYGDIRISEFRRSQVDPDVVDLSSERVLLTIEKPYENHNGGMLQFGADGYLYASVGDGDPGALHPPGFYSQRLDVLLGSILRIDPRGDPYGIPLDNPFVSRPDARGEIWAYGLRNPWRFWIDQPTGTVLIGDVGSTSREEVNEVRPGEAGLNFGWPCYEGTLRFDEASSCELPVAPLLEVPRENGVCALIGGVVVRDPRIPALRGRYLYGDLCAGTVTALTLTEGQAVASDLLDLPAVRGLSSFGVDGSSRVYVTSTRGDVFRLDPR